ncbi:MULTISPECIES: hypothetical protein [Dyella]|uniref:Polymer-forming cytoskeletal protein n=2 Tax=Dyella TaxID=231454 RepID=A0A4R0YPP6_9GAMM|nr:MULTISPECIES: hypothetical protein [Dyella]TBR36552.1 hypothetical protein EYV96_11510 [Dyella terrae]TCI08356.1 hypothetical protein EZM97_27360 [Dyella soli]
MRRTLLILSLALALPLAALAKDNDIDKINGTVRVENGQTAGDVSTVNGAVRIGDNATVEKASTVNGSVELGDKSQAKEISTVNGGASLGAGSRVTGTVETTNGSIRLNRGAEVLGKVSNVNGSINLEGGHVAKGIETVTGDVYVGTDSHVEGGILVDKPSGWFSSRRNRPVHVVIGPHAVVQGTLDFRREVILHVSDSATIGPVKGATAVKFSGSEPPSID